MKFTFWLVASLVLVLRPAPAAAGQSGVVLTGAPTGTTNETNPEIRVSAPNAVAYKYSINGGPYSDELLIQTPINFNAGVHFGNRTFVAGGRELHDFINLRTDALYTGQFLDSIALDNVESQLQITYVLNKIRSAVGPENVLSLWGPGVETLDVTLNEKVATGARYELSALAVTGGQLSRQPSLDSIKRFRLSLAPNADSLTLTPRANNDQTTIAVNGQPLASGGSIVMSHPADGSSISLQTAGPDGSHANYAIEVSYDDSLAQTVYRSYYLRAFNPSSAYLSIRNGSAGVVAYRMAFNKKLGLTRQEIIREIEAMEPQFPDESMPRKVWRFIRDNRYHFTPLTSAPWFSSAALFFNSAGFGFCDDSAALFYQLMTGMGYTARVWGLSGHVVAEALVNDRWEMWDPDLEVYYHNRDGLVAGVEELAIDPTLIRQPVDPILPGASWPYQQVVADIYSSRSDNFLYPPDPMADSPTTLEIPPGGTFEFPDIYETPLDAIETTRVPSYTNARLVVPAGFSGTVNIPLLIHSIGWSNSPRLSVVTRNAAGNWDPQPTEASWIVDCIPPVTTPSQPSGHYNPNELVSLVASEPATIYYTTDGTTPTEASPVYTGPVPITGGGSVKFFAVDHVGNHELVRGYGPAVSQVGLQISSMSTAVANFSASASGGTGLYEYKYLVRDAQHVWSTVQPYGAASTWSWDKVGAPAGSYTVQVLARNAGTAVSYDAFASVALTITVDRAPILANPGDQVNGDSSGSYAEVVLSDAAVAYWRLGETIGPAAADSAGHNPGTLIGGVTVGQPGALIDGNTAMLFDGSSGYVQAANPAAPLAGDLTIEMWINVSLATRQTLISKSYLNEFELTLETSGHLNFYQGNGSTWQNGASIAGAVIAGTWQHVVVTREAATKTVRFYVNGVAKGGFLYSTTPASSAKALSIGRSGGGTQYVNGRLDEVALYPVALSGAQIATHHALRALTGTGTPIELQLTASDPDADGLTYSTAGLPSPLTVNTATGLISGTLSPTSEGTYLVTATASDGSLSDTQAFTWTVTHLNRAPTLTSPGTQTSVENTGVSLQLAASDPDGDALTYSASGLPPSLAINTATALISGTLSFNSAGSYVVTATVSDGRLSSSQTFTWTVGNTNRAPILTNPGSQTNSGISGYAPAVLSDAPVAYWRLGETTGTSAADSAGRNAGTAVGGVVFGQPGALADGNTAMLFNGSSGYLQVASPAASLAGDLTIEMWVNVSLAARQTLISKDYLHEFELSLETSGHLNFYQGNGTTWQNVVSVAGAVTANTWQHVVVTREAATKTIRFFVNGAAKGSGSYVTPPTSSAKSVSIGRSEGGVRYVNGRLDEVALYPAALSAAQVAAHYAQRTSAGTATTIALQLVATDLDGDGLTYSAIGLPPTLSVNAATGLISGTLSSTSAGTYQVTATASDSSLSNSQAFTWTVTRVNRAPTLTSPGNQTSAENTSISLPLAATDPDGDALTYSASGLPASLTLNPTTGLIAGTLSFTSAGSYVVTATASDGSLSSSQTFTWTVANTNRAPVLTNPGDRTNSDISGYAQAVLADKPVAYWRLGGTWGPSAADSAGSNAGTELGGITLGQPGALADGSAAMLFNGSTGYVRVANSAALQLAGDLTLELWLNVSLGARQTLISKSYLHEFELTLETNGVLNLYQGNGTAYGSAWSAVGAVTANSWHHAVVTREAATQMVRFYVDGVARGSGVSATVPTVGSSGVSIGRSQSGGKHVSGYLEEVVAYAAALSPEQIARHYALRNADATSTSVQLRLVASDPDGHALAYSATGLPPGLTIGAATGLISGTLTSANAGTYHVTVTASDGDASQSQSFTWTVTQILSAPTLAFRGNAANPAIDVIAPGKISYRYSINGAPYSPEFAITKPVTLAGAIDLAGRQFTAGTRPLVDFLNLKNTDDAFTEFFDHVSFNHLESQLQVTYMVNKLRTAVEPDNVLNLRGSGVADLNVTMHEKAPAGPRFELSALVITGGELSQKSSASGIREFVLSLPRTSDAITVTPRTNNDQTSIVVNGGFVNSGQTISIAAPTDGSSIVLRASGPDGVVTSYTIEVRYDDALAASVYRSFYLRAFAPASAYVSLQNVGTGTVTYGLTFNRKFGLTEQGLIREIAGMAPEYPGESTPRKVWRFIRDNRYHFGPLTRARWNQSPALFFSSIGFGFCDDVAALFYHLSTAMGYPARVWNLSLRHTVPEVFINNRWEMWDPDLQVYYQNRNGLIAGVEELANDTDLITHPLNPVPGAVSDAYGAYVADIYSTRADTHVNAGAAELPLLNDSSMLFEIPPAGTFEFPDVYDMPLSALYLARVPSYANARLIVPEGFSGSVSMPLVIQSIGWSNNPRLSVITKDGSGHWDSQPTVSAWSVDVESPFTMATQPSGVYNSDEPVTLTASEAATIYYTTDGSTPTEASSVYWAPITIAAGGTVKFFGVDSVGNRERVRAYGPSVEQVQLQMSSLNAATVTFSARASGGVGSYEFSFRMYDPRTGWSTVQLFSDADNWIWNKAAAAAGRYTVEVWVRNRGTTGRVDKWADLSFDVRQEAAPVLTNPGPQVNDDSRRTYPGAVLADTPVAYWRLSEASGITASDSTGANPGGAYGGVTRGQPGALADGDAAALFNGSTGYVGIVNNPALQLAGDLTLELWVNVSLAARQTLISKDYLHEFELTLEMSGRLNFYQGNGTTWENVVSTDGVVAANTWQHLVVTREAATNTIRFYVNGVAKGSGLYSTTPTSSAKAVSIGRSENGIRYVNGRLDEVALYPAALSAAQIATHYVMQTADGTGTPVALQLVASDPDGDGLAYSAIGLPPPLTINAATGLISGTLSSTSAGTYQVTATASDASLSNSQGFTWTVTHVNRAPALTSPGPQTSAENTSIPLQLTATDLDGDALTYSASGLPASVTLNSTTGLIAGTLSFSSAGIYVVTATVSDGTVSNSQTFTWTVANTNRAPVLTNPGAQTNWDISGYPQAVLADAPVAYWRLGESIGPSAADSAGANPGTLFGGVTLGQAGALGDGNQAMRFNGSTGYVRVANSAAVQLVGDLTIEMWVNVSLGTRQTLISKDYLHELELTLETSGHLNFYQGNGLTWQSVASVAGAVTANTWQHIVVTRESATKTIRFFVNGVAKGSGSYGTSPTASAKAVVIGRSDNYPGVRYVNGRLDEVALYPALLSAAQMATHYALRTHDGSGTALALQLTASDPDGAGLTYSATGLPAGLAVNAATGLISGTLLPASAGNYQVTATASDGDLSKSQTFTWTIRHVNAGS
jgi:hypothetical protein